MRPVVDGLRDEYGADMDFRYLDANREGAALFREYKLRYHPAYVILGPDGGELWRGLGELPESELRNGIRDVMDTELSPDAEKDRGATDEPADDP